MQDRVAGRQEHSKAAKQGEMMEYNIVEADTVKELVISVNKGREEGWKPLGGIHSVEYLTGCGTQLYFFQPMTRNETEHKADTFKAEEVRPDWIKPRNRTTELEGAVNILDACMRSVERRLETLEKRLNTQSTWICVNCGMILSQADGEAGITHCVGCREEETPHRS